MIKRFIKISKSSFRRACRGGKPPLSPIRAPRYTRNTQYTHRTRYARYARYAQAACTSFGVNTFTCGAFHVTSKDDVETVASDLRDAIQSKQWMCGFPDKLIVVSVDNYLISCFGAEDLVNTFRDKLQAAYSGAVVITDEPIVA